MFNYTQEKFRFGTVWGQAQTGGRPPGASLELLLVGGIAPILLGGQTPLTGVDDFCRWQNISGRGNCCVGFRYVEIVWSNGALQIQRPRVPHGMATLS